MLGRRRNVIRYHCAKHPPDNAVTRGGGEKRLLLLCRLGWRPHPAPPRHPLPHLSSQEAAQPGNSSRGTSDVLTLEMALMPCRAGGSGLWPVLAGSGCGWVRGRGGVCVAVHAWRSFSRDGATSRRGTGYTACAPWLPGFGWRREAGQDVTAGKPARFIKLSIKVG